MNSDQNQSVTDRAQLIYTERLQAALEASELNRFVAIEPDSGDHFLADSFSQAVAQARAAYPERISFVIRVGHQAALHLGGISN